MTQNNDAKISALLKNMWERHLPTVRERLDILEHAASAAASGKLTETLRREALEIAHKLSGSLGMFGYHHGTEIAREIEQILNAPTADFASRLMLLTTELRRTLLDRSLR